jgi:hypothetical protein
MRNDGLEILDTDDDVKPLLNAELAEFKSVNSDCSVQGLFEDL